eukprot:9490623-Pyramimonas_sp.AAC.1
MAEQKDEGNWEGDERGGGGGGGLGDEGEEGTRGGREGSRKRGVIQGARLVAGGATATDPAPSSCLFA